MAFAVYVAVIGCTGIWAPVSSPELRPTWDFWHMMALNARMIVLGAVAFPARVLPWQLVCVGPVRVVSGYTFACP